MMEPLKEKCGLFFRFQFFQECASSWTQKSYVMGFEGVFRLEGCLPPSSKMSVSRRFSCDVSRSEIFPAVFGFDEV